MGTGCIEIIVDGGGRGGNSYVHMRLGEEGVLGRGIARGDEGSSGLRFVLVLGLSNIRRLA